MWWLLFRSHGQQPYLWMMSCLKERWWELYSVAVISRALATCVISTSTMSTTTAASRGMIMWLTSNRRQTALTLSLLLDTTHCVVYLWRLSPSLRICNKQMGCLLLNSKYWQAILWKGVISFAGLKHKQTPSKYFLFHQQVKDDMSRFNLMGFSSIYMYDETKPWSSDWLFMGFEFERKDTKWHAKIFREG